MAENNSTDRAHGSQSGPEKRSHSAMTMASPPSTSAVDVTAKASALIEEKATMVSESNTDSPKRELYELAKARRIAAINTRNNHLEAEIRRLATEIEAERALLKNQDAAGIVKTHIKLLHEYNEIRDIGQGMIGMIADNRGVRIAELYESGEFGVDVRD